MLGYELGLNTAVQQAGFEGSSQGELIKEKSQPSPETDIRLALIPN